MADVLISTAAGNSCNLDAAGACQQPTPDVQVLVRLTNTGDPPENDMNWSITRIGATRQVCILDAGTGNTTGPKVLQLISVNIGAGAQVVVQGATAQQPAPAITAWTLSASTTANDVLALPATLSQLLNSSQQWCLFNPGTVPNETYATAGQGASIWYLQPSALAPGNLSDYLSIVIDGGSLQAGEAIRRMWGGIARTGWAGSLAPTLLAWVYDFPKWYPNYNDPIVATTLNNILYNKLYNVNPAYKAYFDSFATGLTPLTPPPNFGTTAPPSADPPHPPR
jgi:hypothetical protein